MKRNPSSWLLAAAATLTFSAGVVFADEDTKLDTKLDGKLSDVEFGEHYSGPKIKKSELKGHVVALEIWGTR